MTLEYTKTRNVKSPSYGTSGSAGLDFYIPDDWKPIFILPSGEGINIPSGIVVNLPKDIHLLAVNKSGMALLGLQVGACLIDSDYQGELHLHIYNVSNRDVTLKAGQKIIQFIPIEAPQMILFRESNRLRLFRDKTSSRGKGSFGSTG